MIASGLSRGGRLAVVTGAGSGIGRALALAAARRGMTIAIADVDQRGLDETAAGLERVGAVCHVRRLDVSDDRACDDFAAEIVEAAGAPALLFANAGILRQGSILTMAPEALRDLFAVNVLGVVNTLRAFLPAMRAAEQPGWVTITASTGAMACYPNLAAYCATKHALWPIAEAVRDELREAGDSIGVSLLMPGSVRTAIFAASEPERAEAADAISPDRAAEIAFAGITARRFLILTHPSFAASAEVRFQETLVELSHGAVGVDEEWREMQAVPT